MHNNNNRLKVALIGCGAVAEQFYIAALKKARINVSVCIDLDLDRASLFSSRFNAKYGNDYKKFLDDFDAAIISLPHFLHATISVDLISRGKHILVEKPMALNLAESDLMIKTTKEYDRILAVGNFRRNYENGIFLKRMIDKGYLGDVVDFQFKDGCIYSWPVKTDSFWNKKKSGGGVLVDTGAHTLDQLVFWLGEAEVVSYKDDAYGGVEADCFINLKLESGVTGTVELSRTRNLGSEAIIQFDKGKVTIGLTEGYLNIDPDNLHVIDKFSVQSYVSVIKDQIINWVNGITKGGTDFVSGMEARKSIKIIEDCYANKKEWKLPWV